jgi:hypothetical protein
MGWRFSVRLPVRTGSRRTKESPSGSRVHPRWRAVSADAEVRNGVSQIEDFRARTSVPGFPLRHEIRIDQTLCCATLRQELTSGHRRIAAVDAAERAIGLHADRVTWVVSLSPRRLSHPDRCTCYNEKSCHAHVVTGALALDRVCTHKAKRAKAFCVSSAHQPCGNSRCRAAVPCKRLSPPKEGSCTISLLDPRPMPAAVVVVTVSTARSSNRGR